MSDSTNPAPILYPALCIGSRRAIAVAHSESDLMCCNARDLWGERFYDGMVVVDAASDMFRVKQVRSRRDMNFAKRLVARWRNAPIAVDLELRAEGETTLHAIRQRVLESLTGSPERTPENETSTALRAILERVRETRSLAELISIFY